MVDIALFSVIIQFSPQEASIDKLSTLGVFQAQSWESRSESSENTVSTLQEVAVRKVQRLDEQNSDIRADIASDDDDCLLTARAIQGIVFDCQALARRWCAMVEHISAHLECGANIDLRELRSKALTVARASKGICEDVLKTASGFLCGAEKVSTTDLEIAIREMTNIVNWIETWPCKDSPVHAASRAAMVRGEVCTDEELLLR